MIFVNTKRAADRVTGYLLGNGYQAGVLSGDIPQNKRLQAAGVVSSAASCRFWSRPTWRRAGCTFPMSPTSSTSTCRRIGRITSTGLAAPPGSAPAATPSASPARNTSTRCRRSRTFIGQKIAGAADDRGFAGRIQAAQAPGAASSTGAGGRRTSRGRNAVATAAAATPIVS
jgi:hypothetical protein